jgi:hypothetical protein
MSKYLDVVNLTIIVTLEYSVFSKYRITFCNGDTVRFLQYELYFYLPYGIILSSNFFLLHASVLITA